MSINTRPDTLESGANTIVLAVAELLVVFDSGVLVETVLVPVRTAVVTAFGKTILNVLVMLAPGATLPKSNVINCPLDSVTMPVVLVAVAPAAELLVNTTVPATVVPTCEFVGRIIDVVTSANNDPTLVLWLLLVLLVSLVALLVAVMATGLLGWV